MVRRHFPNLASLIFDVAPPSKLIRITAEIVETMENFRTSDDGIVRFGDVRTSQISWVMF
jgi:hypothetical protein